VVSVLDYKTQRQFPKFGGKNMIPEHFHQVDKTGIKAIFLSNGLHRASLLLPFFGRFSGRTICVIGQNPSTANEQHADKTVHFLERYVFEKLPEYGQLLMLNLYSRVDTNKSEKSDLNHKECDRILHESIAENEDFLFVFGKIKNEGAYKFPARLRELSPLFKGKRIYKFDVGTAYPPHPGNRLILYRNFTVGLSPYEFSDIKTYT
jgi:hypothetical protein